MTSKNVLAAAALTAILSVQPIGVLHAADSASTLTMKPIQGLSFDVGEKRAVSYFQSVDGHCKLVVTVAEQPNWDDVPSFTSTRFEAAIPGGKATRFQASTGKAIEFACQAGAKIVNVTGVEKVADAPVSR